MREMRKHMAWYFKGYVVGGGLRASLGLVSTLAELEDLLADWRNTNTRAFLLSLERSGTPQERYRRMVRMFIDERDFNPALDVAVRQWGSVDPEVGESVREADDQRIEALATLFREAGQEAEEAMVRARIVYLHQIGYYALGIRETRQRRRELAATYDRILTGF